MVLVIGKEKLKVERQLLKLKGLSSQRVVAKQLRPHQGLIIMRCLDTLVLVVSQKESESGVINSRAEKEDCGSTTAKTTEVKRV